MTVAKRGRPAKELRPIIPAFRDDAAIVDALQRQALREHKSVPEVMREILRLHYSGAGEFLLETNTISRGVM